MKKILFSLLWLFIAANALLAQNEIAQDSAYWRKEGERVMQEAPVVFKGRYIRQGAARVNSTEVWGVAQIVIDQVFKGNVAVGDTVEMQNYTGCSFRADRSMDCPMHYPTPKLSMRSDEVPQYFFFKPSTLRQYLKGSSKVFQFFDEKTPYTAFPDVEPNGGIGKQVLRFYTAYENELSFLNVLNKFIPQKVEKVKPTTTPKKIRKPIYNKKGKRIGMRMMLPANVVLSTANAQTTVR